MSKSLTPDEIAKSNSESAHQKALFAHVALKMRENPAQYACLRWLHAIPNGGARDLIVAAKMKAEGVKAGVLDIFLPLPASHFHGLYIEMKAPGKLSNTSKEQDEYIQHCEAHSYQVVICDNWQDAWNVIDNYIVHYVRR